MDKLILPRKNVNEILTHIRARFPVPVNDDVDPHDPHALTALRADDAFMTKRITADGRVLPAEKRKYFSGAVVYAPDMPTLGNLLTTLLARFDIYVVMAALKPSADRDRMRRLFWEALYEPDGNPTLDDVPRQIWPLDCEGIIAPPTLDLRDTAAAADYVRCRLPLAFHHVQCVAVASAKYGLVGRELRFRLWFFFDRPIMAAGLRAWLRAFQTEARKPVDAPALHAAQPVYTASPLFQRRENDPLAGMSRLVVLSGTAEVVIPDDVPLDPVAIADAKAAFRAAERRRLSLRAAREGEGSLEMQCALQRVLDAPEGQRHPQIMREAHILASLVVAAAVTEDEAREGLIAAAEETGKPADEAERCFEYAMREAMHLFDFFEGAELGVQQ